MDYEEQKKILGQRLQRVQQSLLLDLLHRSIVLLRFSNQENQQIIGTGVLISQNIVFTAAHNIYDRDSQREFSNLKLYAGTTGQAEELPQVEGWRYMEEFKHCSNSQRVTYDFAIVKLKSTVKFEEYLPLTQPCEICLPNDKDKQIKIYGFPAEGNFNLASTNDKKLYQYGLTCKNRAIKIDTSKFTIDYKISTLPGQSGSPVVVDDTVIAVHVAASSIQDFNTGRIVEPQLIETVGKWISELRGSPMSVKKDSYCVHLAGKYTATIDRSNQQLNELNLSLYPNLQYLNLRKNNIQEIDLSICPHLLDLQLSYNHLLQINLTANLHLKWLYLWGNKLQSIDLSQNRQLVWLSLGVNRLTEVNCRENTKLYQLYLDDNCLNSIDVTQNTNLLVLRASINNITTIDISCNKKLTELRLHHNNIKEIDLRALHSLKKLYVGYNCLKEIKLSTSMLRYLDASSNYLQQLVIPICKEHIAAKIYTQNDVENNYLFGNQRKISCRVRLNYLQKLFNQNESLQVQGEKNIEFIKEIVANWKLKFSRDCCKYRYELQLGSFSIEL